ncbi:biotin transporter BioY [Gephyromycinifex aptenodytis]|uniref:biotin transporter BioY n=1 Tax=Gephyromycinifex aptenodytis TaxID=2716227 RepID=UPI001D02729F|nr:biotin transporter BioY [Gephyromycinifex aptenodytis]
MPSTTSATAATQSPQNSSGRLAARDLALIASMAALLVVLGIPGALYPFGQAVPITLQSMGVMLIGALLGWKRGALSVLLVLALAAIGFPFLAGGRGGLAVFVGPTSGFLLGWLLGAMVVGAMVQSAAKRLTTARIALAVIVGGIGVIHLCGIPVMMWRAGLSLNAALVADLVFIPGDLIKAVIATVVAAAVHRAMPTLLPSTWAGRASR